MAGVPSVVNCAGLYRQVFEFMHVCLDNQKAHNSGSLGKVSSTVPGNIKTWFINYSGLHLSNEYLLLTCNYLLNSSPQGSETW